jgi:hypothetical protein
MSEDTIDSLAPYESGRKALCTGPKGDDGSDRTDRQKRHDTKPQQHGSVFQPCRCRRYGKRGSGGISAPLILIGKNRTTTIQH